MDPDDFYDEEIAALELDLAAGYITSEEYHKHLYELQEEYKEMKYRQDMIDAGRGHLLT